MTIRLTPERIRGVYHQLAEREQEEDWINDPQILEMLSKREKRVAKEIKEGKFAKYLPEFGSERLKVDKPI